MLLFEDHLRFTSLVVSIVVVSYILTLLVGGYKAPTYFRNLQRKSHSVQSVWHSPNTLSTTVHGQVFCFIT